ncbi:MAG: hypothetical protein ACLFUH_08465 [Bacteroidales bacterium]
MPQPLEPIQHGSYYHIYNRGIDGETLFRENTNYEHFFRLYEKYIDPVADTFAWVMMPNHFHFLVRIKNEDEIDCLPPKSLNPDRSERHCQVSQKKRSADDSDLSASSRPDRVSTGKKPTPVRQFSHLFNAYTKAYNK